MRAEVAAQHARASRQAIGESEGAGEIVQVRIHAEFGASGDVDRTRQRLVAEPKVQRQSVRGLPAVAQVEVVGPVPKAAVGRSQRYDQTVGQTKSQVRNAVVAEVGVEHEDAATAVRLLAVVLQAGQCKASGEFVPATTVSDRGGLAESVLSPIDRGARVRSEESEIPSREENRAERALRRKQKSAETVKSGGELQSGARREEPTPGDARGMRSVVRIWILSLDKLECVDILSRPSVPQRQLATGDTIAVELNPR